MMRKLLVAVLLWVCVSGVAEARERLFGYCMRGGYKVTTQGLQSTEYFQRTFRSCTVRVYDAGTTTLVASIYSDNLTPASTPLANPFTSASDGYWEFYASAGRYDVQFTDTATSTQYTWGDLLACDPLGPNADTDCSPGGGATTPHNLLSETHPDTVPYTPPEIGDFARGNLYQMWERIGVAQVGQILTLIDVGGGQPYPEWVWPSTLDTCGSVRVNGVEAGCEHEINFIPGTNITSITAVDDSDNGEIDVTINASGGGAALTCDPLNVVTIYVDTAGSDITGDGSIGNPYLTIQYALDTDVPSVVDGNYAVQLKTAGTYSGYVTVKDRLFFGSGYDYTNCASPVVPCSNITIQGDVAMASTFIIAPPASHSGTTIEIDASRLTLRGVTVDDGGYGIYATNNSYLTIEAVKLLNNYTNLAILHGSKVLVIPSQYVDDDFAGVLIDNVGFAGNIGIFVVGVGASITDLCEADKESTGSAYLEIADTNGTGWGLSAFLVQGGDVFVDNQINIKGGNFYSEGGMVLAKRIAVDADNQIATGISSAAGKITGGYFDGGPGIYSVSNATNGIYALTGGQVDPPSTVSGVTNVMRANHEVYGGIPHTVIGDFAHFPLQGAFVNITPTGVPPSNATFDLTKGNIFKVVLSENPTNIDIQNSNVGDTITAIFCQDGAGGNAITWSDTMIGDEAVGTTASKCNIQSFVRDDTTGSVVWYAMGTMKTNAD